jgi:hypothetical protein
VDVTPKIKKRRTTKSLIAAKEQLPVSGADAQPSKPALTISQAIVSASDTQLAIALAQSNALVKVEELKLEAVKVQLAIENARRGEMKSNV